MKKIFALLALFVFIGVATTPASATVKSNINKTVQLSVDDDNSALPIQDVKKDSKKKKTATAAKKATATKAGACCEGSSVKSGCGEAMEGCGSSCTETAKKEEKKEVKK